MNQTRYIFGQWKDSSIPLTVSDVIDICKLADVRRAELAKYPSDKVMRLLESVGAKWSDENYPARVYLEKELPALTGFSKEMISLAMKELVWTVSAQLLQKKLDKELRGIDSLSWNFNTATSTAMRWQPLGTVLHVLSGNVFLVGIGSLVEGLITGNIGILKMSSGEKLFLPKLIESIRECDFDGVVSKCIALVDYSSSQVDVIDAFKKRLDGLVVWGGEDAVRAYRNDLPARTKMIVFGPKLSVAMVTKEGLKESGIEEIAGKIAYEMAIWDQNACTAPQLCYIQGIEETKKISNALTIALNRMESQLPSGLAEINTAVEIQKLRGVAEIAEARGEGKMLRSPKGVDWTVIVSSDLSVAPSPLHRTLKLVAYNTTSEVIDELEKLRGYIQTIGLSCGKKEVLGLSKEILSSGALRIHEIGQMSGGQIDDPHDGSYDLSQFGNFVYTRVPLLSKAHHPIDLLEEEEYLDVINSRLRLLVDKAKRSEYYGKALERISINSVKDLQKIPVLTRDLMDAGMPPKSNALSTGISIGGYVSRSGGSTGEPKFSLYDEKDWFAMISQAVRIVGAAGLERGDRVANCMLAGDLYGSFVSFDHINYQAGAQSFAFAGHINPEHFLHVWEKFGINVIEAMPTVLMPLLKVCKQLNSKFEMEKVIYAGTPLSPSDRDWLIANLNTKRISSIIGANDGGQLAFQCSELTGALHHLIDDFNYVEIVNEDYKPAAEGEVGKILITSLLKFAYPLIRYELGDSARFVNKICACGRTNRIIEYMGRSDDTLCVGLMNLRYRDVQIALKEFPISVLQLVARNSIEGEFMVIRIESELNSEEFKKNILETLLKKIPLIQKQIEDRSIVRVAVELYKPGLLPRNTRTGKVKVLEDERV